MVLVGQLATAAPEEAPRDSRVLKILFAISADDKVWITSAGKTISVFDRKTGKPLSPDTGYTKGRLLGRTVNGKPVDGPCQVKGPFHLAIDQQDRI